MRKQFFLWAIATTLYACSGEGIPVEKEEDKSMPVIEQLETSMQNAEAAIENTSKEIDHKQQEIDSLLNEI